MPLNLGCGNSTIGNGICGFGNVSQAPIIEDSFLPNVQTGAIQDAPLIDFAGTKDVVYNAQGELVGMDSVDQQVYFTIITTPFSSINPNMGTDLQKVRTINSNTASILQNEITNALHPLVVSGGITILGISVVQDSVVDSRLNISVNYNNNKLNQERTLEF